MISTHDMIREMVTMGETASQAAAGIRAELALRAELRAEQLATDHYQRFSHACYVLWWTRSGRTWE